MSGILVVSQAGWVNAARPRILLRAYPPALLAFFAAPEVVGFLRTTMGAGLGAGLGWATGSMLFWLPMGVGAGWVFDRLLSRSV